MTLKAAAGLEQPVDRTNIIFILADDLGYADLSCYGSPDLKTPNIDKLAHEGVRLKQCYANSAVCTPTRVAFLTGNNPRRHGFQWVILPGAKTGLPGSERSLPALLRKSGYTTGHFGKWHLGYTESCSPRAHGFDHSFGILSSDADYYTYKNSVGEPDLFENGRPVRAEGYLTDLLTDKAIDFLTVNKARPFFIYLAYTAPHWPFQPPGRAYDAAASETYGPEHGTREDYVRMVERMDNQIGRLLGVLAEHKLTEHTLVIFTSDNGGERLSDNGPFSRGKYTLWEGGVRVPGVARWPGKIPAGTESSQGVITADWTVSILNASGTLIPQSWKFDGENVLPALQGKAQSKDRTFFWRMPNQRAVRSGKWKYIQDGMLPGKFPSDFLFDLEADPGEHRDLALRRPDIVQELRATLVRWEAEVSRQQDQ
jgi:arylsulfatase A-like enzyme